MNDRPVEPPDPTRRRFFRQFAGDVVSSVGSVLGAAQVLQQQSAEAARELLGTEEAATPATVCGRWRSPSRRARSPPPTQASAPRSAGTGTSAASSTSGACRTRSSTSRSTARGTASRRSTTRPPSGSLVQAQLAAVTLALVAGRSVTHRPFARRATVRGAANALRVARPGSAAMAATVDRMLGDQRGARARRRGRDDPGRAARRGRGDPARGGRRARGDRRAARGALAELAPEPAPDADAGDSPRREDSPGPDGDGHRAIPRTPATHPPPRRPACACSRSAAPGRWAAASAARRCRR